MPAALVDDLDPFEVGELAIRAIGWPQSTRAVEALGVSRASVGRASVGTAARRVPPSIFVRAVAAGDPQAKAMAVDVDPLAVAFLVVALFGLPAFDDPVLALDRLVLSERARTLEEW